MTSPPTPTHSISLPGVFVSVFGHGVLLTGPSNIGKSELALGLIDRCHGYGHGHALVADDVTEFYLKDDQVWGKAPAMLADLLELRDIGVINVREMFGDYAICPSQKLLMIITLDDNPNDNAESDVDAEVPDRLAPHPKFQTLLEHPIPHHTLHHWPRRGREILVETMVKKCILSQSGHDASQLLLKRHEQEREATTL